MNDFTSEPTATETPAAPADPAGEAAKDAFAQEVADTFGFNTDNDIPVSPEQDTSVGLEGDDAGGDETPPAESPLAPEPKPVATEVETPEAQPEAQPATPADTRTPEQKLAEANEAARVKALEARIAEFEAAAQAKPEAAPAAEANPQTQQNVPKYSVQLPKELLTDMLSDEPEDNVRGITNLINGIMTSTHNTAIAETARMRESILAEIRAQTTGQALQQEQAATVEDMQKQYFEAFPTHQDANMQAIVQTEAAALSGEFPNASWDADYINALGNRVNAKLTALGVPVAAINAKTPPTKPAAFLPKGNRTSTPTSEPSLQEEIADVLGSNYN